MNGRTKRPNEIEEKAETNNEKKSKVRKISTTLEFISSTRARLSEVSSEVKSEPFGPYHRKKTKGKKAKKRKKEEKTTASPQFFFDLNHWKIIDIKELQNLILHLLTDEGRCPEWLYIKNVEEIKKVVFLMIPGLGPSLFGLTAETAANAKGPLDWEKLQEKGLFGNSDLKLSEILPVLPKIFSHGCVTRAPGDTKRMFNPMGNLFNCYLSEAQKGSVKHQENPGDINERIYSCLLTPEEMVQNDYPLPTCMTKESQVLSDDWVEVPMKASDIFIEKEFIRKNFRILSIDCEMCKSNDLSVLTRVSIVDIGCNVVYDELVMPEEPITDYLTPFSGITEERLKGVTTNIKDVQKRLLELVDSDTVLIGHSLECDMKALKFAHPYVIDTSILYTNPGGIFNKSSLKMLAHQWLKRSIQVDEGKNVGHDSVEDAKAAMDLVKLKLDNGLNFDKSHESLIQRLERYNKTSAFIDYAGKVQLLGVNAKNSIKCTNDDEVFTGVLNAISNNRNMYHNFIWGKFKDLENLPEHENDKLTTLRQLNDRIEKIYSRLPAHTAFIVSSGSGNAREWEKLFKKRMNSGVNWTVQDQEIYEKELQKGKIGLTFFRVKSDCENLDEGEDKN
ncbi:ribonuclease H70 [Rhizophagus clarus]|uniref:Ribonuclease H70 n=1 Tax=Rhizophagus clarus TaxID=94130 RepID=A0A8H3QKI2_9GLOM|nr:ribonuclease H70 [Rhizophagus clarus]